MLIDLLKAPANVLLGRGVQQSTTAAEMCARLEGKCLQIDPGAAGLAAYFRVDNGNLTMEAGQAEAPDATLTGSPLSLARLSGPDPQAVIRAGDVRVSGDSEVAEQFQYLLQMVRPDWEEELSRATGDAVAHEIGRAARGVAGWLQQAGRSVGRSTGEYLTEESRALVTRVEAEEFCAAVDDLSAAVDRFDARLRLAQAATAPGHDLNTED